MIFIRMLFKDDKTKLEIFLNIFYKIEKKSKKFSILTNFLCLKDVYNCR